jgi:uncharacterized cupredoxin-like copper-binding protein
LKRIVALFALAVGIVMVASACGSGDHADSSDSMHHESDSMHNENEMADRAVVADAPEVAVRAASLTFAPQRIQLRAGHDTTIVLTAADVEHDFMVAGVGHVVHASKGTTEKGGLRINRPGTYRFWCSVRGHREAGMTGTITVTA